MVLTDVRGLEDAQRITSRFVWFGVVVQLLLCFGILCGLMGLGFRLRKGVDRTIVWYIFWSSVGYVLQDMNNLAINVNKPYFFGLDCTLTSRFTSICAALGCTTTYAFLLRKSQNVPMKHNLSKRVYQLIYAVIAVFLLVSVIFSSIAFRTEAVVEGKGVCIYQGESNGVAVLMVSGFMGLLNYVIEFLCLYIFMNPLRKLEADIKMLPTGEGFHLRELRAVVNKNLTAAVINIIGSGVCAMTVAFAVFVSPRAADQVYAVISYVFYGFLSIGGLIYCTIDAWTTAPRSELRLGSSGQRKRSNNGSAGLVKETERPQHRHHSSNMAKVPPVSDLEEDNVMVTAKETSKAQEVGTLQHGESV